MKGDVRSKDAVWKEKSLTAKRFNLERRTYEKGANSAFGENRMGNLSTPVEAMKLFCQNIHRGIFEDGGDAGGGIDIWTPPPMAIIASLRLCCNLILRSYVIEIKEENYFNNLVA